MNNKRFRLKFADEPYPLQQEIIDAVDGKLLNRNGDPYRFFVAIIGRQAGKSWLARRLALDWACNKGKKVMWVSSSDKNARIHWNILHRQITNSNIPTEALRHQGKEVLFFSGGALQLRSALEGSNLRGDSVDLLILDESAYYLNGEELWYGELLPTVTATKGKVVFTTTPNGLNWMYDQYMLGQNPDEPFYVSWRMPSSISPYQDAEFIQSMKKEMPEKKWREEFNAEFISDGGGVFTGIVEVANVKPLYKPVSGHSYVCGIDVGFSNDATAICVMDKQTRQQVYGEKFTDIGSSATLRRIVGVLDKWKPEITVIEKNGVGVPFIQSLKELVSGSEDTISNYADDMVSVGKHRIKALTVNNAIKRNMVERLAVDIEYKRVELLTLDSPYGKVQHREMAEYNRSRSGAGLVTYAPASHDGHDDTVSALYLCYFAMPDYKKRVQALEVSTVPKRKPSKTLKASNGKGRLKYANSSRVRTTY